MNRSDLAGTLDFLRSAERLKTVTRTSWTSAGDRESVAEHTWRLALMALVLEPAFPDIDMARLLKMCIIHDLGEAIGGDISAKLQPPGGKAEQERRDLLELLEPLPSSARAGIVELWDEYEAGATAEARLAKAMDKLETIMQHNQGRNPPGFDYGFNLDYGRRHTADDPVIAGIRRILDEETRAREEASMAGRVKGIPDDSSVVIPRLVCRDPAAAIEFCADTFGAVELGRRPGPDGTVAHALLTIGPAMVMIEAEWPTLPSRAPSADGSSPVVIFVYVEDVDATVERATSNGAQVLVPLQDQFWGDRIAWIMDPSGHVWTVATRIQETTAEERTDRWSAILSE